MPHVDYPLCALDLDETLLGSDHSISPRNRDAITAVTALGATVVIASGRMHEATVRYARELALSGPIISYNGAMVKLPGSGEELLHEKIAPEYAAEVMDFCAAHCLQLNLYFDGLIHTEADTDWLKLYVSRTGSPFVVVPNMNTVLRGAAPTKMLIVNTEEFTNSLLPRFRAKFEGTLYVTKSTNEYLEFMPLKANKGAALAVVAARLGVTPEQTVAIGDSFNDIPMVEWAGLGLAVANARPELKAAAQRVIARSDEDGVGQALEELYGLVPVAR